MLFNKRMTQQKIDLSHVVCNWSSWEGEARSDSAVTETLKYTNGLPVLPHQFFNRKTLNMTPASEHSEAKKIEADDAA